MRTEQWKKSLHRERQKKTEGKMSRELWALPAVCGGDEEMRMDCSLSVCRRSFTGVQMPKLVKPLYFRCVLLLYADYFSTLFF